MKNKRSLKCNELIKKLCYNLASGIVDKKVLKLVTIIIEKKTEGTCIEYKRKSNGDINLQNLKLHIDIWQIRQLCRGYKLCNYYPNRNLIVNKFFTSYKMGLRFAILHELYHVKARFNKKEYNRFEEVKADMKARDILELSKKQREV